MALGRGAASAPRIEVAGTRWQVRRWIEVAGTRWQVRGGEARGGEARGGAQPTAVEGVQAQRESENSIARGSWLSSCSLCMF
jgi:hypothetical protein